MPQITEMGTKWTLVCTTSNIRVGRDLEDINKCKFVILCHEVDLTMLPLLWHTALVCGTCVLTCPSTGSICCSVASTNTAVLPIPDLAWHRMSMPRIACGMHSCWTAWEKEEKDLQFVLPHYYWLLLELIKFKWLNMAIVTCGSPEGTVTFYRTGQRAQFLQN